MNQEGHRRRLMIELDTVTREALSLVQGLTPEQLSSVPPAGWSLGQILEHLIIAADQYFARMRGRIYAPNAAHAPMDVDVEWEPSLMGWLLVQRLRAPRRLAVSRIFEPPSVPREDVVEAFANCQRRLGQLILASSALYWNRVYTRSPVTPLLRFNIGDAFSILLVHEQRHVQQMARLAETNGFSRNVALRS